MLCSFIISDIFEWTGKYLLYRLLFIQPKSSRQGFSAGVKKIASSLCFSRAKHRPRRTLLASPGMEPNCAGLTGALALSVLSCSKQSSHFVTESPERSNPNSYATGSRGSMRDAESLASWGAQPIVLRLQPGEDFPPSWAWLKCTDQHFSWRTFLGGCCVFSFVVCFSRGFVFLRLFSVVSLEVGGDSLFQSCHTVSPFLT